MVVQCNHHLVVLPYLKLPFELRSYYWARTYNHSPTRHYPPDTMGCFINQPAFYEGFPRSWQFFLEDCRASYCGSKHRPSPTVCLNHKVFSIYMINKKLYLNLSKYVDKLLVVKTLINVEKCSNHSSIVKQR